MSNEHVRPCQAEAKTLNKAVDLNERVPLFNFDQFLIEILGLQIIFIHTFDIFTITFFEYIVSLK